MKKGTMRLRKLMLVVCGLLIGSVCHGQGAGEFKPEWKSLANHKEVPEWIRDAKFGIYCHWGVYSVPAYGNEHYMHNMYADSGFSVFGTYERHKHVYGPLSEFGYHDFIPMFKGEHFDAGRWAQFFYKTGAKFAGLVAEHHDGFSMWDSDLTPFNARDMGPHHDVVGEMEKAIRQRGMHFFASLHHSFNYEYVPDIKSEWSASDPKYAKLYGSTMPKDEWLKMWLDKCLEVVDKYDPDIMYFDAWLDDIPESYVKRYLAHYFNQANKDGEETIVVYKNEDLPANVGMLDYENSNPGTIMKQPWLCDYPIGTGQSYSWGYTEGMQIRSAKDIVQTLVKVVSMNGQMLLNFSPRADGTIPQNQKDVGARIGRWLWTYGESIYGTRPFASYTETTQSGIDVYYTQKKDEHKVYAIFMDWPGENTSVLLKKLTPGSLDGSVKKVTLMGFKRYVDCTFNMTDKGLLINIPEARLPDDIAIVFKIDTR